jgi:hypothetical protein
MKRIIKHKEIKKGKKKFKLRYFKCFLNIHDYKQVDSLPCDLLDKDENIAGETVLMLYVCKLCGKEKVIATPIILNKNK